jgi:hypothetical protein
MVSPKQGLKLIFQTTESAGRRNGFALVLALTAMSFILLILLVMAAMVKVETSASSRQLIQLQARQNALLAAMIALGELQKHAGPDQRVTAMAAFDRVSDTDPELSRWLSIREANGAIVSSPRWAVTGFPETNNPEISSDPASADVLIGARSDIATGREFSQIRIPLQRVGVGSIGYWISEENMKANIFAGRQAPNELIANTISRRNRDFQFGLGSDLQTLDWDRRIPFATNGSASSRFNSVLSLASLDHFDGVTSRRASDLFHEITTLSRSVLQRPNGGLKRNLADLNIMDAEFGPAAKAYLRVNENRVTDPLSRTNTLVPDTGDGNPHFNPLPIPTEITLWMGLFHAQTDARVRFRYHLELELWNPFSRPLAFRPDGVNGSFPNRALYVEFENLPTITVEDLGGPSSDPIAPTLIGDLNNAFSGLNNSLIQNTVNSWLEIEPDPNWRGGRNQIPPPTLLNGQVYRVLEPAPTRQQGLARNLVNFDTNPSLLWSQNRNQKPAEDSEIRISVEHSNGPVNIIIREWDAEKEEPGSIVARFLNLPFEDVEFFKTFFSGEAEDRFSRTSSGSYQRTDYNLAFHVRLRTDEETMDPGILQHLFSTFDPTSGSELVFDYNATFIGADGQTVQLSDYIESASWNPAVARQNEGDIFSNLDILNGEMNGLNEPLSNAHPTGGVVATPIIAFDLPRRDTGAGTIMAMRGLALRNLAPFALGSPWGGAVNSIFDEFHFSATPSTGENTIGLVSNHWLVIDPRLPSPDLANRAQNAFVDGGFNINSTNPLAWATMLGGIKRIGSTPEINNAFFRAPFYANIQDKPAVEPYLYNDDIPLPSVNDSYNLSARSLAPDQLRAMGGLIAAFISERSTPFVSVAEFLNSGILQKAIDEAHLESVFIELGFDGSDGIVPALHPINPPEILRFSHAFLTQADIVARVGHLFTVRGDTFVIRTVGKTLNPLTGQPTSEAYLEATVQRIPLKVNSDEPIMDSTASTSFGRQFNLISIRWLEGSEL